MPSRRAILLGLSSATLALALSAHAQDRPQVFTLEDRDVEDALAKAESLEKQGQFGPAGEEYAKLELLLDRKREKDPEARFVSSVGPSLDRGVVSILRDRVRALPEDGIAAYRTLADAKARAALEAALESGEAEALELVAERWALTSSANPALRALAASAFERGDLARAERAYARLERSPEASKDEARRFAYLRLLAAAGRGDAASAADALASFEAKGGDGEKPRVPADGKLLTPRQVVERSRTSVASLAPASSVDPGRLVRAIPLASPELPPDLVMRLERVRGMIPAYQEPVYDPETGFLIVADSKMVRAVDLEERGRAWNPFDLKGGEPGRLEVSTLRPALGPQAIYATLHRNRPALRRKKDPAAPPPKDPAKNGKKDARKDDDEDEIVRQADFRIVALDRRTGRLLWDAAESRGFKGTREDSIDFSRDCEWVSAPCYADGQVLVSILARKGADLRAYVVGIDAATGQVRWRSFLASRTPYDFLGIGSPPAAPAFHDYRVYVATGLGVVACIEPGRGDVVWLARYPSTQERSQPEIVREEHRFRAASPLVNGSTLVVAPVDGQEVLALDPETGAEKWRFPRGDARVIAETGSGNVLLAGERVLSLDRVNGTVRFRGEPFSGTAIAPPLCFAKEAIVPLATALVRVSLEDGKVLARYRFELPQVEAGAVAPAGTGRIATASYGRANLYEDVAQLEAFAKGQPRGDAELLRGESAARRGDAETAIARLERAANDNGLSGIQHARARRLAFAVLAEQAARARGEGKRERFLEYASSALEHADDAIKDAARASGIRASEAVNTEFSQRAARLRRIYADTLAASSAKPELERALAEYEKLLVSAPGTFVSLDSGVDVEARAYARMRIRELGRTKAREAYALRERSAAEHLATAVSTGTKEGLERLVAIYPASTKVAEALYQLHGFYERQGLHSQAARALEQLVADEPEDAQLPRALSLLASLDERMHQPAKARRAARALVALESDPRLAGADGAKLVSQAKDLIARLSLGDEDSIARQDAAADLEAPLRRVFRSTTELSEKGAELVEARNMGLAPSGRFLVRRGSLLESRSSDTGVERAFFEAPTSLVPEVRWFGYSGGRLIVPQTGGLLGHDPLTGGAAWAVTVGTSPDKATIGPDPILAVEYGSAHTIVHTNGNDLVCYDSATGKEAWRVALAEQASGCQILAHGNLGIVVWPAPAKAHVDAYELATGKVAWTFEPDAAPGVIYHAGAAHWVGAEALALTLDSKRLAFLDTRTGGARWFSDAGEGWYGDLLPAPDGSALLVRGAKAGPAYWIYDARTGKELWHDDGYGAVLPGPRPEADGALPALEDVTVGETAVYSFRQHGGAVELWAQDLATGTDLWKWLPPHAARGPATLVETPAACLVARNGGFDRATLNVIAKGTGKTETQIILPGRSLVGRGILAVSGTLAVSTDRGTFGFAHVDDDRLARETIDVALELEKHDTTAVRSALADRLARAQPPRTEEAIDACSRALLAEGAGRDPEQYDRLFAQLAALSEASIENQRPAYDIRRMPRPPDIDGELNDWWRDWSAIDLSGPRHVQPIQQELGRPGRWLGPEDLSAKLYMGWDEKYFYMALDVMDSDLRPYDSEAPRWIGDCLLIAIDCKNDGGPMFRPDDQLLSLALTLPKKKKDDKEKKKDEGDEDEKNRPEGKYFVKRKDDGSGAIYEAQIPWSIFTKKPNGRTDFDPETGPTAGVTFGFNIVLLDDDGQRVGPEDIPPGVDPKDLPEGHREGDYRGALKTLQLTPGVLLHERKDRLWQGFVPENFAKITLK